MSAGLGESTNTFGEDFRSLLNSYSRGNSEIIEKIVRVINNEVNEKEIRVYQDGVNVSDICRDKVQKQRNSRLVPMLQARIGAALESGLNAKLDLKST